MLNLQDYGSGGGGGVDLPVAIEDGGTGATTAEDALDNLGIQAPNHAKRTFSIQSDTNSFGSTNMSSVSVAGSGGTVTPTLETTGVYASMNTAATTAARKYIQKQTGPTALVDDLQFVIKTGSNIGNVRIWVGLLPQEPQGVDDPATFGSFLLDTAAFRYSTVAGDTTWQACTANPDGLGASNFENTGVAVAVDTRYAMRILRIDAATYEFSINGVLVATSTEALPVLSANAGFVYFYVQTTENVAKSLLFSNCYGELSL